MRSNSTRDVITKKTGGVSYSNLSPIIISGGRVTYLDTTYVETKSREAHRHSYGLLIGDGPEHYAEVAATSIVSIFKTFFKYYVSGPV